jgi:hypothetical protein
MASECTSIYVDCNGNAMKIIHRTLVHPHKGIHVRTFDEDGWRRRAGCIVINNEKAVIFYAD